MAAVVAYGAPAVARLLADELCALALLHTYAHIADTWRTCDTRLNHMHPRCSEILGIQSPDSGVPSRMVQSYYYLESGGPRSWLSCVAAMPPGLCADRALVRLCDRKPRLESARARGVRVGGLANKHDQRKNESNFNYE